MKKRGKLVKCDASGTAYVERPWEHRPAEGMCDLCVRHVPLTLGGLFRKHFVRADAGVRAAAKLLAAGGAR